MRKAIVIILLLSATLLIARETSKEDDIKKLLDMTGSGDIGIQTMDYMIASFKQSLPTVPEEFWDEFRKDIDADSIVDLIIPIYSKYFTHEDIAEIIKFYETPVGKKYIKCLPDVTRESMAAGEEWGKELAQKALESLEKKGYK